MRLSEYITRAFNTVGEIISNYNTNKNKTELLKKVYEAHKQYKEAETTVILLKQHLYKLGITDSDLDDELVCYKHNSTSYEYNNPMLENELKESKKTTARILEMLKEDSSTKKVTTTQVSIKGKSNK